MPNFFVTSYQNDQNHEVLGKYAQDKGMKKVFIMAPNYQAGKDALAGFKRYFKGEVVDEVYVPLNQLDYSAELSKIAAAAPEAIFVFLPGGMGVNFVKQFRQAGLADKITFLSAFTVDEGTLPAQQDAALGFFGGSNWAPNLDNPQNKAFVAAFEKEYNAVPGSYAFQAYDAALLIDSRAEGDRRQDRQQGRAARRAEEGRLQVAARRLQVQHQPLSDPGLLSGEGGEARRRQVPDRDRPEGVRELFRSAREGLRDEVRLIPPRVAGRVASLRRPGWGSRIERRPHPASLRSATLPFGGGMNEAPMSTSLLIVQTLNGLQLGVLLFLIAAGLTLVFGVMDFINLAHGVQYMLGAYLAVMFYGLHRQLPVRAGARARRRARLRAAARVRGVPPSLRPRPSRSGDRDLRHHPVPEPGREDRLGRGAAEPADAGDVLRLGRADARHPLSGVAARHHRLRASRSR